MWFSQPPTFGNPPKTHAEPEEKKKHTIVRSWGGASIGVKKKLIVDWGGGGEKKKKKDYSVKCVLTGGGSTKPNITPKKSFPQRGFEGGYRG